MAVVGEPRNAPCRYSIQVGRNTHMAPPANVVGSNGVDIYAWRYLNHSCRPNARVANRMVVAAEPIAKGEEIRFDYNTTEYEMASPFHCCCGHCDGAEIRGFRFLNELEQKARSASLEGHLRDLLNTVI